MRPVIRPFRPDDRAAVNALHRSVAWPGRSPEGWRWLDDNPARQEADAPSGWVAADADDRPQAFVGNFVQRFCAADGSVLHGATGFSIIVGDAARGAAHGLIRAVLRQPGMSVHYTLNANPRAARLYPRHGLEPWPTKTHAAKLAWVTDPWVCGVGKALRSLAHRRQGLEERLGERLTNGRLTRPRPFVLPAETVALDRFGDTSAWGDYWRALLSSSPGLVADRSPEAMRWRLANPDLPRQPYVLAAVRRGRIRAHLTAMVAKGGGLEPPALEILDLMALPGERAAARSLVQCLFDNAKRLGAAKVRLQVVDGSTLDLLGDLVDGARMEGGWGHGHARFAPAHEADFRSGWTPTPYDGDYSFCTRSAAALAGAYANTTPASTRQAFKHVSVGGLSPLAEP